MFCKWWSVDSAIPLKSTTLLRPRTRMSAVSHTSGHEARFARLFSPDLSVPNFESLLDLLDGLLADAVNLLRHALLLFPCGERSETLLLFFLLFKSPRGSSPLPDGREPFRNRFSGEPFGIGLFVLDGVILSFPPLKSSAWPFFAK